MATIAADIKGAHSGGHPKGLYALFATEMWERFSFYSMLALFTLYLRDPNQGFGWTAAEATGLYANYLMFVYASPLIGGFLADRFLGYRKAVMIGGVFFMAGHGLLSIPALWAVYLALTCLVIGNGFFKPNVSTMVGNLYPEGSHLKDRAYNIFYMGINVGAASAPIIMEIVHAYWGFHVAFAVAAFGMLISVGILWKFKSIVEDPNALANRKKDRANRADQSADTAATAVDAPPHGISHQDEGVEATAARAKSALMDTVPDWKRVMALIVIFIIVIVFWMVFHQNGSTITYWADDNTAWDVSGIISNAINPGWIIVLTFPLVWFWGWLDKKGMEPSTPTKMAIGMLLTACSFFVLYGAAKIGEGQPVTSQQIASGSFRINERVGEQLKSDGVSAAVVDKLVDTKGKDDSYIINDRKFSTDSSFAGALSSIIVNLRSDGVSEADLKKVSYVKIDDKALAEGKFKDSPDFPKYLAAVTAKLKTEGVGDDVLAKIRSYETRKFTADAKLIDAVKGVAGDAAAADSQKILSRAYLFQVSWLWLILAYAIISLGELMLSPMGLSLVSKVAPVRMRGLLMGGWFVATAIGNKLTMIGIFWSIWYQSNFFLVLGLMAFVMSIVLAIILKPLKKAMPGV
jgi:POT family proton-dependent oligopeptide transporter